MGSCLPLLFWRFSTVIFIYSETNETIPLHFPNVFIFFNEQNSLRKTFLVEFVRSGAASCKKRWEFWRQTHTPLRRLIGSIIFFTCENHRSLHVWKASFNSLFIWRILHGGAKIWILFSGGKTIFYERPQRVSKILFLPRENKIHIFKPPCNVLFII